MNSGVDSAMDSCNGFGMDFVVAFLFGEKTLQNPCPNPFLEFISVFGRHFGGHLGGRFLSNSGSNFGDPFGIILDVMWESFRKSFWR